MKLRQTFQVSPEVAGRLSDVALPLAAELAPGITATLSGEYDVEASSAFALVIEQEVDPLDLELVRDTRTYRETGEGERVELPALRMKSGNDANILAWDILGALSFLTDTAFALSVPLEHAQFVPETDEDDAALDAFGTRELYRRLTGQVSMRTFSAVVDADAIRALLPKREGLRLYADALSLHYPVARFRELWRVLESGFAAQDERLVELLADYAPAQEIGFNRDELKQVLILRGRASHSGSRHGLEEMLAVGRECAEQVNRLKSLVERVILTKKTWGAPTTGVEKLAPASGWVGPGNKITIFTRG
jgi:hypothetical protein